KSSAVLRHNWGIAVHCYRNSLYPKPLNFLFSKIISLSTLKGNRAKMKNEELKMKTPPQFFILNSPKVTDCTYQTDMQVQ
ncbi:MAG: hypothetical protein IKB77_00565, partial [Lentisphaeria bacterium]|nr:hypothetical protein [Lentisphaeria bacterium]